MTPIRINPPDARQTQDAEKHRELEDLLIKQVEKRADIVTQLGKLERTIAITKSMCLVTKAAIASPSGHCAEVICGAMNIKAAGLQDLLAVDSRQLNELLEQRIGVETALNATDGEILETLLRMLELVIPASAQPL